MNNIKYLLFVCLAGLLANCTDSLEKLTTSDISAVSFMNSQFQKNKWTYQNLGNKIAVGSYIAFMDMSQNALSHQWVIEPGDHFLNTDFPTKTTDFTPYIMGEMSSSEAKTVAVLFSEPGLRKIRLFNTFKDSVTFCGFDTLPSHYKDGVWLIDTTMIVEVYDSVSTVCNVMKNDTVLAELKRPDKPMIVDSASWAHVTLEIGDSLLFVDHSTGKPDVLSWTLSGGTVTHSTADSVWVFYNKIGSYMAGKLSASRTAGTGNTIPVNKVVSNQIPLIINVTKSSKPFVPRGIIKAFSSDSVSVEFTGIVGNSNFSDILNNYSLSVTNVAKGIVNQTVNISQIVKAKSNPSMLYLILSQNVYSDDKITLSYNAGTVPIVSEDGRTLNSFSQDVIYPVTNLLSPNYYGFDVMANETTPALGWSIQQSPSAWSFSTEKAYDGKYSIKYSYIANAKYTVYGKYGNAGTTLFNVPSSGIYQIKFMIYLTDVVPLNMTMINEKPWKNVQYNFLGELPRNQWIEMTGNYTITASSTGSDILFFVDKDRGPGIFYIDRIQMYKVETRP